MLEIIPAIIYAFAALFIILDPLLSVPIFVDMTRNLSRQEVTQQAWVAVIVAGLLMYVFLFFNFLIFNTLGITLASFQVAGGILLFILGMQEALGIEIPHAHGHKHNAAGVVIGTPLLCGPGTITTVLLLSSEYGLFVPFVAITLALLATWLVLRYASQIQRLIGEVATDILAKVLGMLVAAIAIQIITEGIVALV